MFNPLGTRLTVTSPPLGARESGSLTHLRSAVELDAEAGATRLISECVAAHLCQAVGPGQVVCHGDVAGRSTVFVGGRAVAFIDWDAIFVASPMWDLAHAVWQFAPVCGDADRWLEGWPGAPDRSTRRAALVGGYGLGAGSADELADMVAEVIAGCRRAVVRKIAAGVPAFVQMEGEGILATLDSQHLSEPRAMDDEIARPELNNSGVPMSDTPSLRSHYTKGAFKVRTLYEEAERSTATGFLYEDDDRSFLITNWHVVTGRRFDTGAVIDTNGGMSSCPTALSIEFVHGQQQANSDQVLIGRVPVRVELFRDGTPSVPVWHEHPQYGRNVDVVAIDVTGLIPQDCLNLPVNKIQQVRLPLEPGVTVFILGYPISVQAGAGLPIWKSGYIASEPELDIPLVFPPPRGRQRVPAFFIDSATKNGMSGAPVIATYAGTWDPNDPYAGGFSDTTLLGSVGREFVGCYSGRVESDELEAGLGICWRKEVIDAICAARAVAPNPHISQRGY